jgi:hypothetical protein
MRTREDREIFGTAFLDVISCGLGAVILMIILAKDGDVAESIPKVEMAPSKAMPLDVQLQRNVIELKSELNKINERSEALKARLLSLQAENRALNNQIATEIAVSKRDGQANAGTMESIYAGGIPVEREYIIFIIDTSGSMAANWSIVMSYLKAIIEAHPKVKGLQVISDNGAYLLKGYAKKWIPDNQASRRVAIEKLNNWRTLSNSSPVEGLETALKTYASRPDPISIYVLGDDFTGKSFEAVTDTIDRWNIDIKTGKRRAIIHALGFSWGIGDRYATLMREVAKQNGGVFVGVK